MAFVKACRLRSESFLSRLEVFKEYQNLNLIDLSEVKIESYRVELGEGSTLYHAKDCKDMRSDPLRVSASVSLQEMSGGSSEVGICWEHSQDLSLEWIWRIGRRSSLLGFIPVDFENLDIYDKSKVLEGLRRELKKFEDGTPAYLTLLKSHAESLESRWTRVFKAILISDDTSRLLIEECAKKLSGKLTLPFKVKNATYLPFDTMLKETREVFYKELLNNEAFVMFPSRGQFNFSIGTLEYLCMERWRSGNGNIAALPMSVFEWLSHFSNADIRGVAFFRKELNLKVLETASGLYDPGSSAYFSVEKAYQAAFALEN